MSRKKRTRKRKPERRLVPKPDWLTRFEAGLARAVPVHPNVLSSIKLLVVLPLLLLGLKQTGALPTRPWVSVGLFAAFALLDYLDGVVARGRGKATRFGRIYDRLTDYPMLAVLGWLCLDVLPGALLAAKLIVDGLLLVVYVLRGGSTENRIRTALSYATLLALLLLSQGWAPRLVTPSVGVYLLWASVAFSATVLLYRLRILQKRFLADALSGCNLLCGVFSMMYAHAERVDVSLLFLLLGAAFDGFDGAAARKFGGTRWGVYSDDVADAVNYGIAPGVAVYFVIGGVEGAVVGSFYTLFTLSRLVFFTLSKSDSDPAFFSGVPSTVGGIVTLCALSLFTGRPLLLGFCVGVACVLMVSFDTHYRHLGRALSGGRKRLYFIPAAVLILLGGGLLWGPRVPVALILGGALLYGLGPMAAHFRRLLSRSPA